MKAWAYRVIDLLATLMAVVARLLLGLSAPVMRLLRLAGLRSRVCGHIPITTQLDGPVRTAGRPHVTLGEHCRLGDGVFFETNEGGNILLGSRVRVNMGTVLVSYTEIQIGDDVLIGEYVSIRDADHGTAPETPIRLQPHVSSPISIGRNAWIARGSVILKGVSIGEGAVVGANSVVTKDVPPNAIAVGAPARVLRYRDGTRPAQG